jgi:Poly A polymerase head domain
MRGPLLFSGETTMATNGIRRVQYYDGILEALQRAIPGSVHIAGGAVRDTILERPIKDIDIFLADAGGDAAAALLRSKFGYVKVGEWKQYLDFSDPMVTRVAKFEKADETIPICLIGLKEDLTPADNIVRFDFGVCMAAWAGGDGPMFTADDFERDSESKTFTLCRADNYAQFAYSMVRYEKLTADRYSGWELSVPRQFEELTKEHALRKHWYRDGDHFGLRNFPQVLRPKER